MGCFLACFGGGDRRKRRRESRREPSASPPPLPDHGGLVGEAKVVGVVVNEASPPLPEAKALTPPPPPVDVVEEVVACAGPDMELRETSPAPLAPEKNATLPISRVKCSPVAEAVVPTPDSELREVSEQEGHSSGKKKVTFDMNVMEYENTALSDQEEEAPVDGDERHTQKIVVFPENHRYWNCMGTNDEDEDEYGEDGSYGDSEDEEDDFMDCKIDEEEMITEENEQESHESLFSLPMSKDQQNDQEVSSAVPQSSGTFVEEVSPLIQGNNLRDRSQFVRPVLNPVQNLSQWKEVKAQTTPFKKLDKENVHSARNADAGPGSNLATQIKMSPDNSIKREISVDASLSTWLVSDNSTVDKAESKSPCSISTVSREERPVLGALTVDDLKKSSAASSPRRSPSHNREEAPILGTVGSYWSCSTQDSVHCSSRSDSGTNGIPNTTSKYSEEKRVNWHATPFNVRLDRALKKSG